MLLERNEENYKARQLSIKFALTANFWNKETIKIAKYGPFPKDIIMEIIQWFPIY